MYFARGVGHLALLQMEAGIGKFVEVADMIVVHVGEDHIAHGAGLEPQQHQAVDGTAQE